MTFKIPLQSEVEKYMRDKKNWPDKFCSYYAERFYNFYMSNGWKVSGKAAMKDWKAAFNSQWQTLKFKEDIDFMNSCASENKGTDGASKEAAYLNDVLMDYKAKWDKITESRLAFIYDYMKENKMVKMTQDEKNQAKEFCNGDVMKGKALAVKLIFQRMITHGQFFR